MGVGAPVLAVLLGLFAVVTVRQARRAWRDPDWEPASTSQSPRSPVPLAALVVSFTVFLAGGSLIYDVPAIAAQGIGGLLIAAGLLGLLFSLITGATTSRWQRPRFIVPPSRRPGYVHPAIKVPRAEPVPPGTVGDAVSGAGEEFVEFVVIAGSGSHLVGDVADTGRLVLTSRRLILSTRRPDIPGAARTWPVAQLVEVLPSRGDGGLTVRLTGGHEERFTVDKRRDMWLDRMSRLLSMPLPVTSWYGDPPGADGPVHAPAGKAVVALFRAEGERRDRLIGYRVLLDGRRVGKIRRGQRIEIPVPAGRHVLHLRSIWVGSPFLRFHAEAGQVIRFCCEPGGFPGMTQPDMERDITGYIRLRRL